MQRTRIEGAAPPARGWIINDQGHGRVGEQVDERQAPSRDARRVRCPTM